MREELFEIKRNNEGFGYLIERDAGSISPEDIRNITAVTPNKLTNAGDYKIADKMEVYAVFQKYGIENANGRIYPETVLRKQVELYLEKVKDHRGYGELNHPESVTLDGRSLSHNITDLWWENHTLVGKMELGVSLGFVNYGVVSTLGDMVANYLRLGWKLGVSSRGLGSVEKDRFSGKFIVQDDFEITCWDIVCEPSTRGSFISIEKKELNQYVESKALNKNKIIEGLDNFLDKKIII